MGKLSQYIESGKHEHSQFGGIIILSLSVVIYNVLPSDIELCAGGTLCDYVTDESKPLDIDLAKQWATGIARGGLIVNFPSSFPCLVPR